MSKVTQNGLFVRPSWDYSGQVGRRGIPLDQLEMLESVRNVCEQIRDSQMMQCDVARAIENMSYALQNISSGMDRLNREIRGLRSDLKKKEAVNA